MNSKSLTFLIVVAMPENGFSGGRYHALMLAKCLSLQGHKTLFLTNNYPKMWNELKSETDSGKVSFCVSPIFSHRLIDATDVDHILCVPDLGWSGVFVASIRCKLKYKAPVTLVNFETPNWFNSMSSFPRPNYLWLPWWILSLSSEQILSATLEGTKHGQDYYPFASKKMFSTVSPPINSFALDNLLRQSPIGEGDDPSVFLPTRIRSGDHKGIHQFSEILDSLPPNVTVRILSDDPSNPSLTSLAAKMRSKGVRLELLTEVSEQKKFEIYKLSTITIFPSEFEGFGYPPIESIASGTQVVAYKLPVLTETLGNLFIAIETGRPDDFGRAIVDHISGKGKLISEEQAQKVRDDFSLSVTARKFQKAFEEIPPIRSGFQIVSFLSLLLLKPLMAAKSVTRRFLT